METSIKPNNSKCYNCGSHHVVKNGKYKNLQRYKCKTCRSTISVKLEDDEDELTLDLIRKALHMYIEGFSLELISKVLEVNKSKLYRWMMRLGLKIQRIKKKPKYKPTILSVYSYSNHLRGKAYNDKNLTLLAIPLVTDKKMYLGQNLPRESTLVSDNHVINNDELNNF